MGLFDSGLLGKARGGVVAFIALAAIIVAHSQHAPSGSEATFASMIRSGAPSAPHPLMEHEWQELEGKHWEIASPGMEDVAVTDAAEGTRGACAAGMVEVRGRMKVETSTKREPIEDRQKDACTDWIAREYPERCARYDRKRWLGLSEGFSEAPMHYCIDRFEYPNRRQAYPVIVVSFSEAHDLCAREDKRMCTEDEWTFACEGEEATPFPDGYVRDAKACVIDRTWRLVDANLVEVRTGPRFEGEIDHLWQGEPSGSHPRCRSTFGVYDTTGNVDEWTTSVRPGERPSILKGGYWGPVRATCRASTRVHGEGFFFYQIGFRCCADAPVAADAGAAPLQ
jgi:hypothetical protein